MSRPTAALVLAFWLVCLVAVLFIVAQADTPHPLEHTPPPTIDVPIRSSGDQIDNLWAWERCQELGGVSMYSPDPESPVLICQGVPA